MRSFVDPEELVAAYWQKLARPITAIYKRRGRIVKEAAPQRQSGNIRVGRDFGDRIEVLDGLKENTKVVINPTDDLREGVQVEVKSTEESKLGNSLAQAASH